MTSWDGYVEQHKMYSMLIYVALFIIYLALYNQEDAKVVGVCYNAG